jgi:hypothetical protein
MADRETLTVEEAIALLPEGEAIHTYRRGRLAWIGAGWRRESSRACGRRREKQGSYENRGHQR